MSKKSINILENLDTLGVSLVKRGANKKKFSISKSESYLRNDSIDVLKTVLEEFPSENEYKIDEILKSDVSNVAKDAIVGALRILSSHREVLPDDVINNLADLGGFPICINKNKTEEEKMTEEVKKKSYKKDDDMSKKDMKGQDMLEYQDQKDEKKKKMKKSELDLSSVPSEIKEEMEKLWKSHEEIMNKNKEEVKKRLELESVLKAERDERIEKEFISKAKEQYGNVPCDHKNLGKVLKKLVEFDSEVAETVESILKSYEEFSKKSELFKELGSSHPMTTGSVEAEVDAKAKSMVEKSDYKLSYSEAYDKILTSDPSLYSRMLQER